MSLWVALFVAAGITFFLIKSLRNFVALPSLPVRQDPADADVTVIIPARNEERNIARAVGSFSQARVIVVDDASEDQTAAIAREFGAEVITAPPVLAGELGKPNACREGARAATSKWLLFVDADTWYRPEMLSSIVGYAEAESLDLVSAFLHQHTVSPPERVLLPYAFALYFCGVSARSVNSPDSKEALANGQCLLVRRSSYEAIGGHGAVAASVIEDVALAALAKLRGLRTRVVRAEDLGSVRMYDNYFAIRRGFEKNSFRFLRQNPLTGVQVIVASILLTSWLPIIFWLVGESHPLAALAFAFVPVMLLAPWYASAWRAMSAPLAIYVFQLIALTAMVRNLRGLTMDWKGRRV